MDYNDAYIYILCNYTIIYIYIIFAQVLLGIILLLSFTEGVNLDQQFTMLEYFSGTGHVSNAFRSSPMHQVGSYEIRDCPAMIFLSPGGFVQPACMNERNFSWPCLLYRYMVCTSHQSNEQKWGWLFWWQFSQLLQHYNFLHRYVRHGQEFPVVHLGVHS